MLSLEIQKAEFMGCFSTILHVLSAVEAELMGVIHAIEITIQKGWRALWIETDVLLNMKSYYDSSLVPRKLCVET